MARNNNMLPKEAIEEFKEIYQQVFKENLSDAEASRKASKLLNLYKAVYGPGSFGQQETKNDDEYTSRKS